MTKMQFEEIPIDEIEQETMEAILVMKDGTRTWVPKSVLSHKSFNEVDNLDEPHTIFVDKWFAKRQGWA